MAQQGAASQGEAVPVRSTWVRNRRIEGMAAASDRRSIMVATLALMVRLVAPAAFRAGAVVVVVNAFIASVFFSKADRETAAVPLLKNTDAVSRERIDISEWQPQYIDWLEAGA